MGDNSLTTPPLTMVLWNQWSDVTFGSDHVVEALTTPVTKVVITLDERFEPCLDNQQCELRMREVQSYYATEVGCPNIPYNFMIGNDGCIYEGRGWQEKPLKSRQVEELQDRAIDIAVIGKGKENVSEALDVLQRFVKECVEMRIVHESHTVNSYRGDNKLF